MSVPGFESTKRPLSVLALTRTKAWQPPTWRLRVELLMPHLAKLGIRVDTRSIPHGRSAKAEFLASLKPYDIVWIHRYTTWPWELRRIQRLAKHSVLDIDDPVGYSSSNFANFSLSRWLKFRATARRVDGVLAASDGLYDLAAAHNRRVSLVRLCAEPDSHRMQTRRRSPGEPLRLFWVGGKSTFKYLKSVRPHLEAIGRLGRPIELVVVGHSHLHLEHLPVDNIQWSREAELEQFARCHVGLVPLTDDRWTRAKAALKPLQYLANGLPFIASPVGVNLRIADEGRNAILAQSPDDWAAAAARLEADEELRLAMGERGIRYIRDHHSQEVLAELVARHFRELTAADDAAMPKELQLQPRSQSAA